jgi:hypothetical protein
MTAMTGIEDYDREEAIWFLQEYPLDLVNWDIQNSHRRTSFFWSPTSAAKLPGRSCLRTSAPCKGTMAIPSTWTG